VTLLPYCSGERSVAICAPRGITAVIPEPSNQVGLAAGAVHEGPPTELDAEDYESRNVVERGFNTAK